MESSIGSPVSKEHYGAGIIKYCVGIDPIRKIIPLTNIVTKRRLHYILSCFSWLGWLLGSALEPAEELS